MFTEKEIKRKYKYMREDIHTKHERAMFIVEVLGELIYGAPNQEASKWIFREALAARNNVIEYLRDGQKAKEDEQIELDKLTESKERSARAKKAHAAKGGVSNETKEKISKARLKGAKKRRAVKAIEEKKTNV